MTNITSRGSARLAAVLLAHALILSAPAANAQSSSDPWFGVTLPPPAVLDAPPVVLGDRPVAPAVVPSGEAAFTELQGARMMADLRTIVEFSRESRRSREIGSGQLWGRVTGLPSGAAVIEWATAELRDAGIANAALQRFQQTPGASLWLPESWEVALVGSPSFGPGTRDVVLQSAMPLSGTEIPAGLNAPIVFVGTASPAELEHVDVSGRIAIQKIIPQGHTVFTRSPAGPRATELLDRGAVAVINIVDLPGNVLARDMSCGGGPCFNIGGQDGLFLESVMNAAAESGQSHDLRIRMRSTARSHTGLSAANGVGIIHGRTGGEPIVVNAHADAWFEGAGDNGDGLAVMLALARHFAQPDHQPERDLVFVVSAGHHSSGLSGPANFVEMNPEIASNALLVINLEHTSQREITPARSEFSDGYRQWVADSYEAPIVAGVSNGSQFLERLVADGIARYGTNFVSGSNAMASGEGGSYVRAGLPVFTTMQGPPLYHTTGEVIEMISEPGMERMARFMAFFLEQLDVAPAAWIKP